MGKGIELARIVDPDAAKAIEDMKDQLILVLVARLGGAVDVPCAEIDGTGSSVLMMEIDPASRCFHFELRKKQ